MIFLFKKITPDIVNNALYDAYARSYIKGFCFCFSAGLFPKRVISESRLINFSKYNFYRDDSKNKTSHCLTGKYYNKIIKDILE